MSKKEEDALIRVFERMYKYYHGWHFAFEHPGFFVYHQMGGDLSVLFTPDWNERGKVAVQIHDSEGRVLESQEVPYSPPARNGIPYERAEAYTLFRLVRPFLDANMKW